ncbi:MAG: hypothetical protein KAH23_04555 [Kiritimatiellae bacterium]|nr:hypothetical protein [Kiritimatiellia bacterium]
MKLDEAYQQLKNGFEADRLAQAYIVVAPPRGAGSELAERLLQLMFCLSNQKPCGECRSCLNIVSHSHPDLLWMEPVKKSRVISVDQIRVIGRRIAQTSFAGGWKACVVLAADRMNPQAANAFLKTLEEPAGKSILILLTDSPQSLLPTIISRCQRIMVAGEHSILREEWKTALFEILTMVRGNTNVASMAVADMLTKLLKEMKGAVEKEEEELSGSEEVDSGVMDARVNSRYKEMRSEIMRLVLRWYRDVLLIVSKADSRLVHNIDYLEFVNAAAARLSYRDALANIAVVEVMNRRLEMNIHDAQVMAAGFSSLK